MPGNLLSRGALFEQFDAPFAQGATPSNQDFQDLGASYQHKLDPVVLPPLAVELTTHGIVQPSDGSYLEVECIGGSWDLTPIEEEAGDFAPGHLLVLANVSLSSWLSLTFDPDGLALVIDPGKTDTVVRGYSGWRKVSLS